MKERLFEHKNSVKNEAKNVVGVHFNGPGHSLENLKITAIENVFNRNKEIILKRESFFINTFEAEYKGLNARKRKLVSFRFRNSNLLWLICAFIVIPPDAVNVNIYEIYCAKTQECFVNT